MTACAERPARPGGDLVHAEGALPQRGLQPLWLSILSGVSTIKEHRAQSLAIVDLRSRSPQLLRTGVCKGDDQGGAEHSWPDGGTSVWAEGRS